MLQPLLCDHGLCQAASDALRRAGVMSARIVQTDGDAEASKGTHAMEPYVLNGRHYCAAVDLSVHGMTDLQIQDLLVSLAREEFAAFYRRPGFDHWPADEDPHIHAIYCAVPMKIALQHQVKSWLDGRNGLLSNAPYQFWKPCATARAIVSNAFYRHNPNA